MALNTKAILSQNNMALISSKSLKTFHKNMPYYPTKHLCVK